MLASLAQLADGPLMTPGSIEALRAHAIEAYPEECLGYVDPGGIYHRLANISAQPEKFAQPDPGLIAALLSSDEIRALCHSHPGGPDCPSELDMRTQRNFDLPFVIVATNGQASAEPFAWGDQIIDQRPLIGRPFRHGVDDCYALIRAYWQKHRGETLPDFPRQWEWWGNDAQEGVDRDLYRRYFASAGFYEIDGSEAGTGDIWLAAIRSEVPNHAGVYLDRGLALHHAALRLPFDPARLSRRDPISRWIPYITHWVRRDKCLGQSISTGP